MRKVSISRRLMFLFLTVSVLVLSTILILDYNMNQILSKLDMVYESNVQLNQFSDLVVEMHENLYTYLETKSTPALEEFYKNEKELQGMIEALRPRRLQSKTEVLSHHICGMTESYIRLAEDAILGKRGRNIKKYSDDYAQASRILRYIRTNTNAAANFQLTMNTNHYETIRSSFRTLELFGLCLASFLLIAVVAAIISLAQNITIPLAKLSKVANEISDGNMDKDFSVVKTGDEIEVLSRAVQKMMLSIREYMHEVQRSLEKENEMKEKELLMQKHLVEARLNYLQAQINPHFLFNSLNAGMQLATLEDAERTSLFIEKLADFYRYNLKQDEKDSTLEKELLYVDSYMYIMDVRFMGSIKYKKELDESLMGIAMPAMILQPIVENAVKHGIRSQNHCGTIQIRTYSMESEARICIIDDGEGISEERLKKIMCSEVVSEDGNGIGLWNIIKRLQIYYKRDHVFRIESEGEGKGTTVTLTIPKQERGEEDVSDFIGG